MNNNNTSKNIRMNNNNTSKNIRMNNNNTSKNIRMNDVKYNINSKVGILDPNGNRENPLTRKPYTNLEQYKSIANGTSNDKGWRYYPVYEKKDEILKSIYSNNVVIAKSGTGSGKTVLLPKLMLHVLGYDKPVVCTVPKKLLAQSNAEWAAKCLNVKLGEEVGYYFKGTKKVNENGVQTKLIFTTIGSLKSRLTGTNAELSEYGGIIIDEAHERSVATDFTFLLLKNLLQRNNHIKVLIMSATLDQDRFKDYYSVGNVKVGTVNVGEKTKYHIEDKYETKEVHQKDLEKVIINKVIHILETSENGAILVFVKSGSEGNKLCSLLQQETKKLNYYPFCTSLSGKSYSEIHSVSGKSTKDYAVNINLWREHPNQNKNHPYERKVVMTTNVAESSITVKDAVYVIDSGKELTDRYNPEIMSRSLKDEWISQSAATQRRGRVGRIQEGICYHLYTEKQFQNLEPFPTPDIQKTDLSTELLDLMKLNDVNNVGDLNNKLDELMQPPEPKFRISALNILHALGAITNTDNNGFLTPLGVCISNFRAIEPIHARALISSYNYNCREDVVDMLSMMELSDSRMDMVFKEPREKEFKKDFETKKKMFISEYGDFFTLLKIYRLYQKEQLQTGGETNIRLQNNESNFLNQTNVLNESSEEQLYNNNGNLIIQNNTYKKSVKKWCEENYLSYRLLKRIKSKSKETNRILLKNMRDLKFQYKKYQNNPNSQLILKELDTELAVDTSYLINRNGKNYLELCQIMKTDIHSNILRALLDGYKIHICKKNGKQFTTCFPQKITSSSISNNTTIKNVGTYIIYNELFEQNGTKINMANKLTEKILRDTTIKQFLDLCKVKSSILDKFKKVSSRKGSSRKGSSKKGSSRKGSSRKGSSRKGSSKKGSSKKGSSKKGSSRKGSFR